MYLAGALVGEDGFEVVCVPHDGILKCDARATENRPARASDLYRFAYVVQLAKADLRRLDDAGVLQPAQVERE